MLVLFDQGTPAPMRQFLRHHTIATAFERGWSTLKNGELLSAAEAAGYAVFVTTDTNLKHQQNLGVRRIAVVLTTTSWPRIRSAAEQIAAAIDGAAAGGYIEVRVP